jgi:membrane protease YdiL (CAAX protease family)
MPQDSLSDLAYAPFQMKVMKKPEVWGGILGALALGTTLSYFAFRDDLANVRMDTSGSLMPLLALPIGIGEESFFRGFVQPACMELCGSPWGGITLSSLSFGAAHIGNAKGFPPELQKRYYTVSIPFLTSFGAYFGWLAYKNCSLKEAVAIHAWYDFTLMAISALAETQANTSEPRAFAISLPF